MEQPERREDVRNDWTRYPPRKHLQRRTNTPKWQRMRAKVLQEQPRCKCGAPATEADHIIPKCLGGSDKRENLQGICRPCHLTKSALEANHMRWHVHKIGRGKSNDR